jgi:SAM-dependent methyltransferase
MSYRSHFRDVAAHYDDVRGELREETLGLLVEHGDLAGRRVLEVGCGTGARAVQLAQRHGARVTGLDASAEMLVQARDRAVPGVEFVEGRAEELPFADATFERVLFETSIHLVDRAAALPQAARVLAPGGRLAILTVDPAGVDDFWLAPLLPSWAAIDRARFPSPAMLAVELDLAGLPRVAVRAVPQPLTYTRDRALELLRGRYASSFALLPEGELEAGIALAERTLPDVVESTLALALVVADAGGVGGPVGGPRVRAT